MLTQQMSSIEERFVLPPHSPPLFLPASGCLLGVDSFQEEVACLSERGMGKAQVGKGGEEKPKQRSEKQ